MSPPTGRPVYKDGNSNSKQSSAACRMERQHRKGLELFIMSQKSNVSKLFRGFRQGPHESMTEEVTFAADANPFFKNGRANASCKCKLDRCSVNTAIPFVGLVSRTFSGALPKWGFLKQSASKKKLEAESRAELNAFKRTVRSKDKRREMPPLDDHVLLFLLNRLDAKSSGSAELGTRFGGCNAVSETAESPEDVLDTRFFCEGGFLHSCSVETSKIVQILSARTIKPRRRKQKTLGFACLQGASLFLAPGSVHPEVHSEGPKIETPQNYSLVERQGRPIVPLCGLSLTTLLERIPHVKFTQKHQAVPDKERLTSVQDFFRYTESEGRRVFQELDRDKDGQITLDDLNLAMEKLKLPSCYAKKFLHQTQSHWLAKSFGWSEFSSLIQEKEPMMIRLFNSLGVSDSGTVQRSNVKDLLMNAGLPATEDNAFAMMKFLGANKESSLKYGEFRKFMLLVPTEQLVSDPWSIWFKAATVGCDTLSSDMVKSIFNHCTLFSRGLVHQFETAKATVVLPYVGNFEDVSNLLRLQNCLSDKQASIPSTDTSDLNNGIKKATELQVLGSCKTISPT